MFVLESNSLSNGRQCHAYS